jgi:Flp pilus assembly protein TadB
VTPEQASRGWLVAAGITAIGTVFALLILIDYPSMGSASMFVLGCGLVAMWLGFARRARRQEYPDGSGTAQG